MATIHDKYDVSYLDIETSNVDYRSMYTTVLSVTSSTLPNKDIVFIYRTSDGTTTRVMSNRTSIPSAPIDRFQQIILDLEE